MNHLSLNSSTNKRILWDILKDNNVFDNMKNSQYYAVKNTFDTIVLNTSKSIESSFGYYTHVEKNKLIIEQLIPAIENIRSSNIGSTNAASNPSMKVIYDANNIGTASNQPLFHVKKSEQSEYHMQKFNQQKRDRELSLDKKVPDIDFSDKSMESDSPIGNDMDRLIAERLASRERELSLLPPPSPTISENKESVENKEEKKSVTFSEDIEKSYENDENLTYRSTVLPSDSDDDNKQILTASITGRSSKLKLKNPDRPKEETCSITESQYYDLLERIKKMENQISVLQSSIQTSSIVSSSSSSV